MSFEFLEGLSPETVPQGLEIGDPDLESMRALAEAEDYPGLLDLARTLTEKQIFDIRIIIYALYGEARESGVLGATELLQTIAVLLKEKWAGIGPESKRDRYAKSSLSWIFSQLRIDFERAELEAGETWTQWLTTFSLQDLSALQKEVSSIGHAIREVIGEELAGDPSSKLTEITNWLGEFGKKLPVPEQPQEEALEDATEEKSETRSGLGPLGGSVVGGSVHLEILIQKLALFERVMESGDMVKAAVIVSDIMEIIEQFDPRLYLPSLFSRFFSLMTPRIAEIYEMLEMRETPQFQSLHSLYKVDMEAFLNLEMNP